MLPAPDHEAIDGALLQWRQGDAVLEEMPFFLHLADIRRPLTPASRALAAEGTPAEGMDALAGVAASLLGIVVASQACDVVHSCKTRPFVEVCALAEVSEQELEDVRRLRRLAYAFLPRLGHLRLVGAGRLQHALCLRGRPRTAQATRPQIAGRGQQALTCPLHADLLSHRRAGASAWPLRRRTLGRPACSLLLP